MLSKLSLHSAVAAPQTSIPPPRLVSLAPVKVALQSPSQPQSRTGSVALASLATAASVVAPRTRRGNRGKVAREAHHSRVVALVGRDGAGKSKVCAALLELAEPNAAPPETPDFADKKRLLEAESAEGRRNFTCYNHYYSQQASLYHQYCPRLHLIDTPGHADRLPQMEEALRIAHGAVVVCSLRQGNAGATGHIFNTVKDTAKPMVVFLNGVDGPADAADFEAVVDSLEQRMGVRPVVLFAPIYAGGAKAGHYLLNVLDGTVCSALECTMGLERPGGEHEALPDDCVEWAQGLREQLIDALSNADDELMEEYLEYEGEVPTVSIRAALRRAAAKGSVVPLVAGSAKSGLGVDALQEVVQTFIPLGDVAGVAEELGMDPKSKLAASEQEMMQAPFLGWVIGKRQESGRCLLHVRILQGMLYEQQKLNLVGGKAGSAFTTDEMFIQGPRGALQGLLAAGPGDLIYLAVPAKSEPKDNEEFMLADATLDCNTVPGHHPDNLVRQGCSTFVLNLNQISKPEQHKLLSAIRAIQADDHGVHLEENAASGQKLLSCMGPLHVELLRERLVEEFAVLTLPLGEARVDYRATMKAPVHAMGEHIMYGKSRIRKGIEHKSEGRVDAWAKVEVTPGERGSGISIEEIASKQQEGLREGISKGLQTAGPSGIPLVDVHVRVLDSQADTNEAALGAAVAAIQKATKDRPKVQLLEPIVNMELDVPTSSVQGVLEDLQGKRRGCVFSTSEDVNSSIIGAEVPLREVQGFSEDFQKMTDGEGQCSVTFHGYKEVIPQVEKDIMEHELKEVAENAE